MIFFLVIYSFFINDTYIIAIPFQNIKRICSERYILDITIELMHVKSVEIILDRNDFAQPICSSGDFYNSILLL